MRPRCDDQVPTRSRSWPVGVGVVCRPPASSRSSAVAAPRRATSATTASTRLSTRPSRVCCSSSQPTAHDHDGATAARRAGRRRAPGSTRRQNVSAASYGARAAGSAARQPSSTAHPPSARLVADTADGHHDLGVLRVVLDLGPQPLDVHVDQPGVGGVPVAPDLLEQDLAGEHLPRLARQADQQVELSGVRRSASPPRVTSWPATSMARSPIVQRLLGAAPRSGVRGPGSGRSAPWA